MENQSLTTIELRDGERIDDLQRNGYKIIQNKKKFCFGMDAVLLSGFASVRDGETVLDITIAPRNDRWLGWGISGFCIMASLIFCFGMWQGVIPLLMAGFLVVNLAASRLFAEKEIPVIQNVFEITLRQLEKKYKDKNL